MIHTNYHYVSVQHKFSVCKAEKGGDAMTSLTDNNERDGILGKRNIRLIGVGHTSIAYPKFVWEIISQVHPFCMSNDILPDVR